MFFNFLDEKTKFCLRENYNLSLRKRNKTSPRMGANLAEKYSAYVFNHALLIQHSIFIIIYNHAFIHLIIKKNFLILYKSNNKE